MQEVNALHLERVVQNVVNVMCKSQDQQESVTRKHVNELEYQDEEGRDISYDPDGNNFIVTIEVPANNEINVTAKFNNSVFELKIDSGAKCNVISLETIKNRRRMRGS